MLDMRHQIQSDLQEIRGHAPAGLSASFSPAGAPVAGAAAVHGGQGGAGGFADSLRAAVQSVDEKEQIAAGRMADVDSGRSDDLVGAMLSSQEASLSFAMLTQVRNKVMGAVDELMKLPV